MDLEGASVLVLQTFTIQVSCYEKWDCCASEMTFVFVWF